MKPMVDLNKAAVLGDADLVFAFRALGFKVYTPRTEEETRGILEGLEREGIALILAHQKYLAPFEDLRKKIGKKFCPVVIAFSDHREAIDHLDALMRQMTVTATGTDLLVKGRGQDETR